MELTINSELQDLLQPLSSEEYAILEQNIITANYCREPLMVWNGTLIDGHNRYAICNKHNLTFTTSSIAFNDIEEAKDWVDRNQAGRRNMTADYEQVVIGRIYNRTKKTIPNPKGVNKEVKGKSCPQPTTAETVASQYQVSPRTVKNYGKFADEMEKDPELKKAVKEGRKAAKEYRKGKKQAKRKANIETIKQRITTENETVTDKFDVLVIDPPWNYAEKGASAVEDHDPDSNRGVVPYPTMTLEDIGNIQLPLKDNAVVFLWTTHAFLHDAFHLLDKWGLTYKATIVWDKEKMGIGRTIRLQCEFCLLATKGKPLIEGNSTRDIIREARRQHSRKPEAFYKMVEDITTGKRLDYFAREQRKDWSTYGIEADKF
jgi:N6-adenosine-specific RNA methylase IME4